MRYRIALLVSVLFLLAWTHTTTAQILIDFFKRMRPGDPPTASNARALLKRLFFDPKKYDLTRVGRYKINQKLQIDVDPLSTV